MKVRATIGFVGKLSMYPGEEREITDKEVLKDLLSCGYIEEIGTKKTTKKGVKKDESKWDTREWPTRLLKTWV